MGNAIVYGWTDRVRRLYAARYPAVARWILPKQDVAPPDAGSPPARSLGEVVVETPLERGSAYGRDPPPVVEDAERPSTLVGALSAASK